MMRAQSVYRSICLLIVAAVTFAFCSFARADAASEPSIKAGHFSKGPESNGLPNEWKSLHFSGVTPTKYEMTQNGHGWVVKAVSESSASGLIRRLEVDPRTHPIMKWRWKIENTLEKSNLNTKAGDDHPARMYVGFEYDRSNFSLAERFFYLLVRVFYGRDYPSRAISYVWASHAPKETIRSNPYTGWVRTIVASSGKEQLNHWVDVERNVYEDYKKAFGGEPPKISGIGIMTDSDGTEERAAAHYGDIEFRRREEERLPSSHN